jgi:hypothetical protein
MHIIVHILISIVHQFTIFEKQPLVSLVIVVTRCCHSNPRPHMVAMPLPIVDGRLSAHIRLSLLLQSLSSPLLVGGHFQGGGAVTSWHLVLSMKVTMSFLTDAIAGLKSQLSSHVSFYCHCSFCLPLQKDCPHLNWSVAT